MSQALKSCDVQIITGFNVRNKCMYNMGIFMGVLFFSSWSYLILWTYFLRVSHMKFVLVRGVNNRTQLNEANKIRPRRNHINFVRLPHWSLLFAYFHENAYNEIEYVAPQFHVHMPTLTFYLPTLISDQLFSWFRPERHKPFPKVPLTLMFVDRCNNFVWSIFCK